MSQFHDARNPFRFSHAHTPRSLRQLSKNLRRVFSCAALFAVAWTAQAQTTVQFASGVTAPQGGVILQGAAINPNTGAPVRHLWSADATNGLCRLDPDLDTAGAHSINPATCLKTVLGNIAFNPGELSFDPGTGNLYVVDNQGKSLGIFRLHFLSAGDSGQGLLSATQQEVLGGVGAGGTTGGGCGIGINQPLTAVLGPDGDLYVGFKRSPNIMRILARQTEPLPCGNVQSQIATSADLKLTAGLGFMGHDLFGVDARTAMTIFNADSCFTPQNGFLSCPATVTLTVIAGPTMISDQAVSSTSGTNLYFSQTANITRYNRTSGLITLSYGGTFSFATALVADASVPGSTVLYVGDDPSNGLTPGQGRWFRVSDAAPAPAPPGTPTAVTATAGDTLANVSWARAADGQPVTSFTVRNSAASNGVFAPDVFVTAAAGTTTVPGSVTVNGLTDGVTYQFEVLATNSLGSSAFSAPSNPVTPVALTVPGAPTGVSATATDAQALVVWTPPSSNGNTPITSYTVSALVGGVPAGITATVAGSATGAAVSGLTDGVTYTFTVHATNAIGSGAESAPSNAVTPLAAPPPAVPDLSIAMSGPASASFQTDATYVLTVRNASSTVGAAQVNVTDTFPALGATFISAIPSQGACQTSGTTINCQLDSMAAGATATITVQLEILAQMTNQASVVALDASGSTTADPTPADNSASVSTSVALPTSTTDIQVTGSAQNGGPAAGSADTYTWQIKNGNNQVANGVVFSTTLPSSFKFGSVTASAGGTCSAPPPGTAGGIVTCSTATLPVGQTMVVTINITTIITGTIPTTGTATFNGIDTNTANNSFSVTIQVK